MDPEFDTASNRKEYQEYFLGGYGGRSECPIPIIFKHGSIKLLESSGPVMGLLYL